MINPSPFALMLCWNFPPAVGGIEYVARNIYRQLRLRGWGVTVLARYANQPDEFDAQRPSAAGLFRYLFFSFFRGLKIMRRQKFNIIVCPGIIDAPVAWLLSIIYHVPFVILAHGSDVVRSGILYRAVSAHLFRAASAIAANSRNTRDLLLKRDIKKPVIRIIHPGVEMFDVPDNTLMAKKERSGPVLITAGRIIRRKGIGEFIEHVMPRLLETFPALTYVVAGADATQSLVHKERLLDVLKRRVSGLKLDSSVQFTGPVTDLELSALYEHADIFVMPVIPVEDDVEGFGIVLLEAARHRLPSVSTRCGGIPDAVIDGVTGYLVEPKSWGDMTRVITDLLENNERRSAMGEAARRRAGQEFSWDVIGRQYDDFFRQIDRPVRVA